MDLDFCADSAVRVGNIGYKWRMKNPRMTNGDKKDKLKA